MAVVISFLHSSFLVGQKWSVRERLVWVFVFFFGMFFGCFLAADGDLVACGEQNDHKEYKE